MRSPTKSTDPPPRPKSAMRFLAAPAYLTTASPAPELKSVDAVEYFSKCEGYIGGISAFVSRIESKLNQVKRDNIVNIEAARSEVRRLMQELDRERWTTKKLSLTVDQKNQKIHELTQALKTEQVHARGPPGPCPKTACPVNLLTWPPVSSVLATSVFVPFTCLRRRFAFSACPLAAQRKREREREREREKFIDNQIERERERERERSHAGLARTRRRFG